MRHIVRAIILTILFYCQAYAQSPNLVSTTKQERVYNEYYTINEPTASTRRPHVPSYPSSFSVIPAELSSEALIQAAKRVLINLLSWTLHEEQRPLPQESYARTQHFGRWINDPTDDSCMNTRAKVLVRESEEDVTFRHGRQCVVDTGKWLDRYSNNEYRSSREVQIDHMVPLKHAYLAGAWKWDYRARCLYANYLGYRHHLLPASIRENTSKGDRAPDKYLPSELSYRCQYIKDWLMIKLTWKLNMTEDEAQAIHEVITNYDCNPAAYEVTAQDVQEQRQIINENIDFCVINRR